MPNVTVAIDELVNASGPRPHSEAEHQQRRHRVWDALGLFAHIGVFGRRPGYENVGEKLRTFGPLIAFTERADEEQLTLDGSEPPAEVSYVAGPWLERQVAADPALLPYFWDVLAMARVSNEQPRYRWMHAIDWALGHRARLGAAHTPHTFRRRDLLDYLDPEPRYADILAGNNPGQAIHLWNDAISLLKQNGRIGRGKGDYVEHGPAPWKKPANWPKGKPFKPQGWQEAWLSQRLTIRVVPEEQAALETVKASAQKAIAAKAAAAARNPKPQKPGGGLI